MTARESLALAMLLACSAVAAQDQIVPDDGAQIMARLETRLLSARKIVVESTLESTGAISAKLAGRTELRERNHANASWRGDYASKPADLALSADGWTLEEKRGGDTSRREIEGRELNRALLIGLLRMGLLHNIVRLAAAQTPDHSRGGVEQWVTLDAFRPVTFPQGGELEGTMSFGFDVMLEGETLGSARIWLDPATGLPKRRALAGHNAEGDFSVVEEYSRFEVE